MNTQLLQGLNFTVGPSKLYDGVAENFKKNIEKGYGSLSHRSEFFSDISQKSLDDCRNFFNIPDNYKIFYTYSATESLELSIRALITKKSIHFVNGTFGWVWANLARKNGKKVVVKEEIFGKRTPLEISDIEKKNNNVDLICITANETSSGIAYSSDEIKNFSHTLSNNTLLAIDVTSSMGALSYDFSSADIWAFSVQKAMGLPAGLGLIVLSPQAYKKGLERESEENEAGMHHSFSALEKKMNRTFQTPTTPNILGILSFAFICNRFLESFHSIKKSEQNTKKKAIFLYDFFDNHKEFKPFIVDKKSRSETIIVIEGTLEKIRKKKKELIKNNVLVGNGYGLNKETQIRISNFPVHTLEDMKKLVTFF